MRSQPTSTSDDATTYISPHMPIHIVLSSEPASARGAEEILLPSVGGKMLPQILGELKGRVAVEKKTAIGFAVIYEMLCGIVVDQLFSCTKKL